MDDLTKWLNVTEAVLIGAGIGIAVNATVSWYKRRSDNFPARLRRALIGSKFITIVDKETIEPEILRAYRRDFGWVVATTLPPGKSIGDLEKIAGALEQYTGSKCTFTVDRGIVYITAYTNKLPSRLEVNYELHEDLRQTED